MPHSMQIHSKKYQRIQKEWNILEVDKGIEDNSAVLTGLKMKSNGTMFRGMYLKISQRVAGLLQ